MVRKKLIFPIIMLLLLIVATVGVTFAAFTFAQEGTVENTLETSTIMLTYTEGKTGITLNEVYPMSDDKGKVLIGENNVFDFTVQATLGKSNVISYEVTAVKIPINDMTPLEDNEVKLYLERAVDPDTTYQEVLAPSNFLPIENQSEVGSPSGSMILDSGTFMEEGTTIHNYRLRLWVDEGAQIPNGESRKYGVKVNVYAKQLSSESFTDESCFTFDSTTGTITGYSDECSTDVVIPYTIDGVKVTAIGNNVFQNRTTRLTSVVLPNTITSIGDSAFYGNRLTSLSIPSSVTSIGASSFGSNQLTEVTIPAALENIGELVFYKNQLTNVIIPNGVKTIGKRAFADNQLISVVIPDSITSVGERAFENNQITNLTLFNSVVSIGKRAFINNQLPDSQAFVYNRNADGSVDYTSLNSYGGANKENIVIPDTITTIGDYAFYSLQLSNIILPDTITSIGAFSFGYNQLTEVTIPSNVTKIGGSAFLVNSSSNPNLTKIINTTGRKFVWDSIITGASVSGDSGFVTGTPTFNKNVQITAE